jgi:hypothetical protein
VSVDLRCQDSTLDTFFPPDSATAAASVHASGRGSSRGRGPSSRSDLQHRQRLLGRALAREQRGVDRALVLAVGMLAGEQQALGHRLRQRVAVLAAAAYADAAVAAAGERVLALSLLHT